MQRLPSANPNFMIRCELVSVKMLKKHFRFSYKPKKTSNSNFHDFGFERRKKRTKNASTGKSFFYKPPKKRKILKHGE